MPKFRVELMQKVFETATMIIEADDQELAETTALNIASGVVEPQSEEEKCVWQSDDVFGEMEVTHAEEWPPVNDPDPPETSIAFERTRDLYSEG